jgi:L-ascorbate metabolism protein UlaG (beta-lactamase superfamily)
MSSVRFLGHSTLLLELDGTHVITDPILRSHIPGLIHRHPLRDHSIVDVVQGVLISHAHHDHLDLPSLRRLPPDAQVLAPVGSTGLLRRIHLDVREMRPFESYQLGNVGIVATPAKHFGYRPPYGPFASIGFVLEGSLRIYFAGDTDVFPEMRDLGSIDLALLPVSGWGPVRTPGHMGPRQAVHALHLIQASAAIPIHWGSLVPIGFHNREWSYLRRPPQEFAEIAQRELPDVAVTILEPGETLELQAAP